MAGVKLTELAVDDFVIHHREAAGLTGWYSVSHACHIHILERTFSWWLTDVNCGYPYDTGFFTSPKQK